MTKFIYNSPDMTAKKPAKKANPLEKKIEELEAARARLAADYANLERRMSEERTELRQTGSAALLEKLFPIFDNFYRASAHAPTVSLEDLPNLTEDDFKRIFNYFNGLKMIEKQMEETLAEAGLKRIPTKGEQFDPNVHEAISYEPSDLPADYIIDEIEAGWLIDGKIVRPAKVRVSQG